MKPDDVLTLLHHPRGYELSYGIWYNRGKKSCLLSTQLWPKQTQFDLPSNVQRHANYVHLSTENILKPAKLEKISKMALMNN